MLADGKIDGRKKIILFHNRSRFLKIRSCKSLCSWTLFPVQLKSCIAGIHTYEFDLSHRFKSTDGYRIIVMGNDSNINCTKSIRKREWKDIFSLTFLRTIVIRFQHYFNHLIYWLVTNAKRFELSLPEKRCEIILIDSERGRLFITWPWKVLTSICIFIYTSFFEMPNTS